MLVPLHMQDLAFPVLNFMRLLPGHFSILLRSFWRAAHQLSVSVTPPYFVFCKLAKGALFPMIQIINEDAKTGLASVLTSGSDLPPSGLCDSDYSPFRLPFQPVFSPPPCHLSNTHFACDRVAISYISTISPKGCMDIAHENTLSQAHVFKYTCDFCPKALW